MKLISACSGIGSIDLGLERAGFHPIWQIEFDRQARKVLERHWPDVPKTEDLRHATDAQHLPPQGCRGAASGPLSAWEPLLIAAGTPCQDWSVAGDRRGLAGGGERAALFYDYIRLADRFPWAWLLWENVEPGVRTSHEGRDFALCLEGFTGARFEIPEAGWQRSGIAVGPLRWCCWRVFDLQHFGVPQRRRRIFVVAGPRGSGGPEVLLEPESLPGDSPASGAARPVASTVTSASPGSGYRLDDGELGQLVTAPMTARGHRAHDQPGAESLLVVDAVQITSPENRANPQPGDPSPSLAASSRPIIYEGPEKSFSPTDAELQEFARAYQCHGGNVGPLGTIRTGHNEGGGVPFVASTITASHAKQIDAAGSKGRGPINPIVQRQGVRRLTPREVERLFGLPDDWTRWAPDGKELADSPRYRMLGNGAGVPVIEWIGRRLAKAMKGAS